MSYYGDAAHPRLRELAPNGQEKQDFLAWFNDGYVIDAYNLLQKPGVTKVDLLPEAHEQATITPRLVIVHTQASKGKVSNEAGRKFALTGTNIEPHIFGPQLDDGAMLQVMPFVVRADAASAANAFGVPGKIGRFGAINVETQDLGGATVNNTPFTPVALNALVGLVTAVFFTYRIPCRMVPVNSPSTADWAGLSWHAANSRWSNAGHSCPGAAKIAQMPWLLHEVQTRLAYIYDACGEELIS